MVTSFELSAVEELVELSGTTADNPGDNRRFPSSLSTDNRKAGDIPGELTINTKQLIIRPDGRISASNAGQGRGGNITVNASDSTLASLWQVNDASTAQFMIKFYQELNNPRITKAEALRNVQRAFLTEFPSTDYNRPYHWPSFILVGNWF
ncbi:hypothetical protein NUACC21_70480 [Scytonema sp. NUACC21]